MGRLDQTWLNLVHLAIGLHHGSHAKINRRHTVQGPLSADELALKDVLLSETKKSCTLQESFIAHDHADKGSTSVDQLCIQSGQ